MAQSSKLPCDSDGACMVCKQMPPVTETLSCNTCATPWHLPCLTAGDGTPKTMAEAASWLCPDCTQSNTDPAIAQPQPPPSRSDDPGNLVAAIRAIESDASLTEKEKAKRRQELVGGAGVAGTSRKSKAPNKGKAVAEGANLPPVENNGVLDIFDGSLNCSFCVQLPERPVTTPCGHNFCLKCFQKWIGQGKRTCANCRRQIPHKMASNPRINDQLAIAIRVAKLSRSNAGAGAGGPPKVYHYVQNKDRPEEAFTTERAKKAGLANASSGRIFVTVPPDHFGPIPAENDPESNRGVLVGDTWKGRMECRQWGVHVPHIAGIAGQQGYGAQSVALSGGYIDDEDHGEWFLYTGSGGRDLSGNKRTNKTQSFDQQFGHSNEALRVSCRKGYPVRVVRTFKEKRSSYAPTSGVRYDGIYRIEKCWRKVGIQGCKVCRYLFVRCDNEPAPWTSDDCGDRPRPLPLVKELKDATDITERKGAPSWDYDEDKGCWLWKKPPPESQKSWDMEILENGTKRGGKRKVKRVSVKERLLKEFSCSICHKVLDLPLTTPCAHNFCKACLEGAFSGQSFIRKRAAESGRTLRAQKNVMKCPSCSNDIADFLQNPEVNREMMRVIESLQREVEQKEENAEESCDKNDETEENAEDQSDEDDESGENAEESSGKDDDGSEEDAGESSDKNDENSHNLRDGTDVSRPCDSSESVLEEINDNDLNQQTRKRRKSARGEL